MNTGIAGFSNTTGIVAIDITDGGDGSGDVDFTALDPVIDAYYARNNNVAFTLQSADTLLIGAGEEGDFLTFIGARDNLQLTNQHITVDSGVGLTAANAKTIAADTTGTVTATIDSSERLVDLVDLRQPNAGVNETNAFTIVISTDDATIGNAAHLNTIDDATSVAVNAANVTSLTGTASALNTLYTAATSGGGATVTGLNAQFDILVYSKSDLVS